MKLEIEIDDKEFEWLMGSCNSSYWAEQSQKGDVMRVRELDAEEGKPGPWIPLTEERRREGLRLLFAKAPRHAADFVKKMYDGDTGDAWLQLAVLGEVKYG